MGVIIEKGLTCFILSLEYYIHGLIRAHGPPTLVTEYTDALPF